MTLTQANLNTTVTVQEIVAQADRLGLVWKLRPGTVQVGSGLEDIQVNLDGDGIVTVSAISLLGLLTVGDRVMTLIVPPSGIYIIGHMDNHAVSGTVVTAGAGLVATGNVFDIVSGDGDIVVSANQIDLSAALHTTIANAMQRYSIATVGDGVSTTIDITHGISGGVSVVYGPTLMDNATNEVVIPQFFVLSSTQFRLVFGAAPALNQYTLSLGW